MKKIILTMLAAVAVTASFAQNNPKIDKEIKATKEYQAGADLLNSKLSELNDEEKGKAYAALYTLAKVEYDKALAAINEKKGTEADNKAVMNAINVATLAKKYGAKDGVKLVAEVAPARGLLINAANSTSDNADKLAYSMAYIDSANDNDAYIGYAGFFASYVYFQAKDYANAEKYAKIGLTSPDVKDMAGQVYVASVSSEMKTKADTLRCINVMKEVDGTKYFSQIVSYTNAIGEKELAKKMIEDEIAANPQNKMAYAVKGETEMAERNYDAAIADFKKTVEIDPQFTAVWFNLGVCASQKGFDLNEKYTDKNGRMTKEQGEEVTKYLKEAITYYEKVQELDPNHETISNWPMQLRMLYNAVGDKAKADEISKMLGDM